MYRDNSLIPVEAVRLCALGRLMEGSARYAELAGEVRHFTGRFVGPSLELLGTSIELLRLEGLVAAVGGAGMEDNAELAITEDGRRAFRDLMGAAVRAPSADVGRLVVALKLRFIHLLAPEDRREQAEVLVEACQGELARLEDLRRRHAEGHLAAWLDLDIAQARARLDWFKDFQGRA